MSAGLAGLAWWAGAGLASPFLRLSLRLRLSRGKEIAGRLGERRGIDPGPSPAARPIWVHAASVGEANAVAPLVERIAAMRGAPPVLVTTGTATAARLVADRIAASPSLRGRVLQRMAPLDVPAWVARFLSRWRPGVAVLVESELWPNRLRACRARGIPLVLVNARMSERSARAWGRVPGLAREMLAGFERIVPRSEEDAARFRRLGARVEAAFDLKAAAPPLDHDGAELARLTRELAGRPRWIAASTHPGEEAVVADAHRTLAAVHPELLTIVVPRHPERGEAVASLLGGAPRRSLDQDPRPGHGFWVVDRIGELGLAYRLCGLAFVGRSLTAAAASGGQNPLEPARLGLAVATGPRSGNFADAAARLRAADALRVVDDAASLARWAGPLLARPAGAAEAGRRAAGAAAGDDAPLDRLADAIAALAARPAPVRGADPGAVRHRPALRPPSFWRRGRGGVPARLLAPLGMVVASVAARRSARPGKRLAVPVFCCGNATVGGAGKTILALDLVARLRARGVVAHVLTRGHGGASGEARPLRVDPARHAAREVGDEALLLAAQAPTWIDRDRVRAGRAAIAAGAGALVMDDGFQNPGLARDCALLLIDGPAGFGNGRVLPAGPLRERPADAVRRARAIVLVGEDETGAARRFRGVRPILRASLVPDARIEALVGRRVVAFAGIGRPEKFFGSLREAGVVVVRALAFPDHAPFRASTLRRLAAIARREDAVLVTTEKDHVRLPPGAWEAVRAVGVGLRWRDDRIETLIERALDRGVPG